MNRNLSLILWIVLQMVSVDGNPLPGATLPGGPEKHTLLDSADLGPRVYIFDPGMDMREIQDTLDAVFQRQYRSEFTSDRYALLFLPGAYGLDIKVGYYMQVAGLGHTPQDVVIRGAVRSISKREGGGHVLTNFWRSVENLTIDPAPDSTNVWGVSQAAPMRRVWVRGNLQLHDRGYASGGFLADSKIDGTVLAGGQQQWFSRNCQWGGWTGGAWNILSLGVENAPEDNWPEGPYTTLDSIEVSREKPFLSVNGGTLQLTIPDTRYHTQGISWSDEGPCKRQIPISKFYVAFPGRDNSVTLNSALRQGMNLLFTPGTYPLETALEINEPGTIIAGLGMPSLMPVKGNAAMVISEAEGLILSGLLFDAGPVRSEKVVVVGPPDPDVSGLISPPWLFDLFFRVGGPAQGSSGTCLEINCPQLYADHLWIWRADHGNGVGWDLNRSDQGLVVNGDQVTIYGLFNEHHQKYQTVWNGEHGKVYLYQSEMPYDPPSVDSWKHDGIGGYASYKVSDRVSSHEAWGVGVYCVFYDAPVVVDQAIETPPSLEDSIRRKFTFWLNGNENSSIQSIINGKGAAVHQGNRKSVLQ